MTNCSSIQLQLPATAPLPFQFQHAKVYYLKAVLPARLLPTWKSPTGHRQSSYCPSKWG